MASDSRKDECEEEVEESKVKCGGWPGGRGGWGAELSRERARGRGCERKRGG